MRAMWVIHSKDTMGLWPRMHCRYFVVRFARYTPSWFCVDAVMQCVTRDHGEVQIQPSLQYSAVMRTAEFVQMCVTRRRCNADRPVVRKT